MAKLLAERIKAQNSIYMKYENAYPKQQRTLEIKYCLPDKGINRNTGIIVLVQGYGASIESNVYKKMMNNFSDSYNMIVAQCAYFGSEFMGSIYDAGDINISGLCDKPYVEKIKLSTIIEMSETIENFNDMGPMQALDQIEMVLYLIRKYSTTTTLNLKNIVGYGHSHGAYVLYQANRYCPNLFTYIIDNSSWIKPSYFEKVHYRKLSSKIGPQIDISIGYKYWISNHHEVTGEITYRYLPLMYEKFMNKCSIISLHGEKDTVAPLKEKLYLESIVDQLQVLVVREEDVDGKRIKSTEHGLQADFILLFDWIYSLLTDRIENAQTIELDQLVQVRFDNKRDIVIDYNDYFLEAKLEDRKE